MERIREIKRIYEEDTRSKNEEESNIKMGYGGIRDIEFTLQMLQLKRGVRYPVLQTRNTFQGLIALRELELLPQNDCQTLIEGYEMVRRIENRLQLYENRRTFHLPQEPERRRWLARSLGFKDSPQETAEYLFERRLRKLRQACRKIFERVFFG